MGRTNPIHTMLRTGTDAYSGVLDKRGIRAADDMVTMPLQCGTQWDGLGTSFMRIICGIGYDCREVTSAGAQKCGIEKTKNKMVGRGVFLDVARYKGVDSLDDGYGITNDDLYNTAKKQKQKVELKRGDLRHRAHRHDGALPEGGKLGRLSRRRLRRVSHSKRSISSSRHSWRRLQATPGAARCAPNESEEGINSPGTGSRSRSWA